MPEIFSQPRGLFLAQSCTLMSSSSCYRDSVVNASGRYVGGTAGMGNNGHLSVASAASIDSEARRFSIDSGDVRADFYRDG